MNQIEISTQDYSQTLAAQAFDLWQRYGENQEADDQETLDDRFSALPFGYVTAQQEKQLVGTVLLHKREIDFYGERLLLGGFGGVVVHPEYRRQGVALALLRRGIAALRDAGVCRRVFMHRCKALGRFV